MNRVLKKRSELLNDEIKDFLEKPAIVLTKEKDKSIIKFDNENTIEGTCDDYKLRNLLDLGIDMKPAVLLSDNDILEIKGKIENFAKQTLDIINNPKTQEE